MLIPDSPPFDTELERMWLYLAYSDREAREILDEHCFYVDDYKKIYQATLVSTDVGIIANTTGIKQDEIWDILGLFISDKEFVLAELIKYKNARILLRGISRLDIQARSLNLDWIKETLEKMQKFTEEYEKDKTLEEQTLDYYEQINQPKKVISSWYTAIDKVCDLRGGQLVIIAGRPWMGKTTVMLNKALRESITHNVGFISMEMNINELIDRLLCIMSWLTSYDMRDKKKINDEIVKYLGRILNRKLFLSDKIYKLNKIEEFIIKNKLEVCYIDYLGLIQHGDGRMRTIDRISTITGKLKQIALKYDVEIVLWSQLSRETEKRIGKEPQLSDLRDSGSIEQDADVVMMLYRPDYYDEETDEKDRIKIYVRKNRNGRMAELNLWLRLQSYRMLDLSTEY